MDVNIYLPAKYVSYAPYRSTNGFHIGVFSAYDPLSNSFAKYICNDFGQYPWGRSSYRGTMAYICHRLDIQIRSNVCNTCLPLHVTIGLLEKIVLSIRDIVVTHGNFFRNFLSSSFMRDALPTINSFFRNLKLDNKVCVRIINAIEIDKFMVLKEYFGNTDTPTIHIVHSQVHYF